MPTDFNGSRLRRATQRMTQRLARSKAVLPAYAVEQLAAGIAAAHDRASLRAVISCCRTQLASAGHAVSQDLLLEAAAAFHGCLDWNRLSSQMPAGQPPASSSASSLQPVPASGLDKAAEQELIGKLLMYEPEPRMDFMQWWMLVNDELQSRGTREESTWGETHWRYREHRLMTPVQCAEAIIQERAPSDADVYGRVS